MKLSELIERLGITREMLRYYEKVGLITPERSEENGYRNYSEQDGIELLRIKDIQAHRVPVQEIKESLDGLTLEMQRKQLLSKEVKLQEEIRSLNAQMLRIQRHRMFIEESMTTEHTVSELDTYGIYKLMLLGAGIDKEGTKKIAAEWIRHMPFTEIGWAIPWPTSFEGTISTKIGLVSMPHCAFEQKLTTDEPVYFLPPGRSILLMVSVRDPFHVPAEIFKPLAEYAAQHQMIVTSEISGRYSGFDYVNGEKMYFFSARVLVKNIKKST